MKYVINAMINKEGYYFIKHVEPMAKISDETIKQDTYKYEGILSKIPQEVYLVFRDEIIRDLERNESLFDEER